MHKGTVVSLLFHRGLCAKVCVMNYIKLALSALVLLFVTSCAADMAPDRIVIPQEEISEVPDDQVVIISTDFSNEEIVIIIYGFEEWFWAIEEARLKIYIGSDDLATIHRVVTPLEEDEVTGGLVLGRANTSNMWLWPDYYDSKLLEKVVRHEVGHYLGSSTHSDAGNALVANIVAKCINEVDIDLVCAGRGGCVEETFADCE